MIELEHPANRGIVEYLRSRSPADRDPQRSPDAVDNPHYTLGTHPEIVERLWSQLGGILPQGCNWILYGSPVLAHPGSGVVFGWCGGSLTYALRLPPESRRDAIARGARTQHDYPAYPELGIAASSLDLSSFGPEWVFGAWLREEPGWCLAAYEHAARSDKEPMK